MKKEINDLREKTNQSLNLKECRPEEIIKNIIVEREVTDSEREININKLNEQIDLTKQAEDRCVIKDQFIAILSHDLKDLLSCIMASNEFIAEDMIPGQRKFTKLIEKNSQIILKMVNDLLDAERIAKKKVDICLKQHDLTMLLKDCYEIFKIKSKQKNITLKLEISGDPVWVNIDPERIFQVMMNLVSNSLKFTEAGGVVIIKSEVKEGYVAVSVSDTGIGICEEDQRIIFDKFSQVKNNYKSGLGLGLFICNWIIDLHHSKIEIQSAPSQGCCFSFKLKLL